MNITVLDNPIFNIPCVPSVPISSPVADQFPIDACKDVHIMAVNSQEPALVTSAVQLLKEHQKHARTSPDHLALARCRPSAITSLQEHHAFFDQDQPLIQPTMTNHKVFSTVKLDEPTNFGQALKGKDHNN